MRRIACPTPLLRRSAVRMPARRLVIALDRCPYTGYDGTAERGLRYARAARQGGWDVEIVAVEAQVRRPGRETVTTADGIVITRANPRVDGRARLAMHEALLARGPFDLVLAFGLSRTGAAAVMAARTWQVPSVAVSAGQELVQDLYDPQWSPFLTWTLQQATDVAVTTDEQAEILRGLRPGCGRVWPEAVDLERYYPRAGLTVSEEALGWSPSGLRVTAMHPPQEAGGLLETLQAFGGVRRQRQDAQLILPGRPSGPTAKLLESWRQQDPLSANRVAWLPEIEEAELPEVLALMHQVWLPWRRDIGGPVLLQAMACERPIIATRVGDHARWLTDGETGLLIPPRDPQALARTSLQMASRPDGGRQLGIAARQALPADVSPQAESARLLGLLSELVPDGTGATIAD